MSWPDLSLSTDTSWAETQPSWHAPLSEKLCVGLFWDKIDTMQEKIYVVLTELMGLLAGGSPLLYDHDGIIAWGSVTLGSFGELYWEYF